MPPTYTVNNWTSHLSYIISIKISSCEFRLILIQFIIVYFFMQTIQIHWPTHKFPKKYLLLPSLASSMFKHSLASFRIYKLQNKPNVILNSNQDFESLIWKSTLDFPKFFQYLTLQHHLNIFFSTINHGYGLLFPKGIYKADKQASVAAAYHWEYWSKVPSGEKLLPPHQNSNSRPVAGRGGSGPPWTFKGDFSESCKSGDFFLGG